MQSLDVGITTTWVEMFVAPTMDVFWRGVLIGSAIKLSSGFNGILVRRKKNGSMTLLTSITGVVGTPQMVFTNPIMTTHVNRIKNRPPMNSMATGRYRNVNVVNPKGGYQKPFIVIIPNFYHRIGHYVGPNKVALKYFD